MRIAAYPGTFDPPTIAHLAVAEAAWRVCGVDRVDLVLSVDPIGKAGANRWRGKRPKVRGVAMNPVDHPLGGGEGKSSGGRPPVSPWGKREGVKTRKNKKASSKLVVRGRKRGRATK